MSSVVLFYNISAAEKTKTLDSSDFCEENKKCIENVTEKTLDISIFTIFRSKNSKNKLEID